MLIIVMPDATNIDTVLYDIRSREWIFWNWALPNARSQYKVVDEFESTLLIQKVSDMDIY